MREILADEPSIVERILNHIDRKTTDLGEGIWREPVEHYTSPQRFCIEIGKAFRRTPTPFCPSAALPEAGSYVARDAVLTPAVAIRGNDGVARAFRNAFSHRGVQLAQGAGCKKVLTCRYHGWTYGPDGALRGIPDEHGFPDIEKAAYGLVAVRTEEKHGMIFVTQDGPEIPEAGCLPDLFGPDWKLFTTVEQEIAANWLSRPLETAAGLMLVGLGGHVLWRLWCDRAIFIATAHISAHSHAGETTVHAVAPHAHGFRWRTLLVGLMHGVAGSAALLDLRRPRRQLARPGCLCLPVRDRFDDRYGRAVLRDRGADRDFHARVGLCKIACRRARPHCHCHRPQYHRVDHVHLIANIRR